MEGAEPMTGVVSIILVYVDDFTMVCKDITLIKVLGTRPDLSYAVGVPGRHAANPGEEHQRALDWVFMYATPTPIMRELREAF